MFKKLSIFIVVFGLLIATGWAVIERQYIRDLYVVQTAQQQPAAIDAAKAIQLTDEGMFLYNASQPKVQGAQEFKNSCNSVAKEQSIVLGCYTGQRIYVYEVNDERLDGVVEVTAAHELLHAAYERMNPQERSTLNVQLRQVADTITDSGFQETLDAYRKSEPGELNNEIHSILGTEIAVLPQSLEDHYAKYFASRAHVVELSQRYKSQFDVLEAQRVAYDAQLQDIKAEIDSTQLVLIQKEKDLNSKQAELASLQNESIRAYNAQVPVFNTMVQEYNTVVARAEELTNEYNSVLDKRNALASTQNDLIQKLDSNFQTR